ncbi:MAG: hypothetical protein J4G06_01630 [Caldilineaceae bacterium]|nr:hypothetical protein [Caldilineaceae bacterium]
MAAITRIDYMGWSQVQRIATEHLEAVVVHEIGPRIVSVSLPGRHNMFGQLSHEMGQTGGDEFRLYGGQRLWSAPEENSVFTYFPDNGPAEVSQPDDGTLAFTAPVEPGNGVQKELVLTPSADQASIQVLHRITNRGTEPIRLAPWAVSVMNLHGTAIVPLPPFGSHDDFLAPVSNLVLWAYTDLTDPRWTVGSKYVLLRQDAGAGTPQKLGLRVAQGWSAYVLDEVLFVKTFADQAEAEYPDLNSNVEIYTDARFLEVETLGPLASLAPGESATQTETWHLVPGVPTPACDDDVERDVMPVVNRILETGRIA